MLGLGMAAHLLQSAYGPRAALGGVNSHTLQEAPPRKKDYCPPLHHSGKSLRAAKGKDWMCSPGTSGSGRLPPSRSPSGQAVPNSTLNPGDALLFRPHQSHGEGGRQQAQLAREEPLLNQPIQMQRHLKSIIPSSSGRLLHKAASADLARGHQQNSPPLPKRSPAVPSEDQEGGRLNGHLSHPLLEYGLDRISDK